MKLLLTCEHGGNHIPIEYESYFNKHQSVLNTHRGYDIGSLDVFNSLKTLAYYSKYSTTSRLLVELNRSLHHQYLFSEFSKPITHIEKQNIINNHYLKYRNEIESFVKSLTDKKDKIIHISVHSFTPFLNGNKRNCDIGLLYDPKRKEEKNFCKTLKYKIQASNPSIKVRYNYPYLGKSDGFTTYLRKQFSEENYLGIELEINQKLSTDNKMDATLKNILFNALNMTIKSYF